MTLRRSPCLALLLLTACADPNPTTLGSPLRDAGSRRPAGLSGRLTPPPGELVHLLIYFLQPDGGLPEDWLAVAEIAADGHFSAPVTVRPLLVRWQPRGASQLERVVTQDEGEVLLTTPAGVTVRGDVRLRPRAKESLMVELWRRGELLFNAQRPPYEFRGVTPGPVTLEAGFGGLGELNARCVRRELQVGTEDLTFDVDLRTSWTLSGRVVDLQGKPVAGQFVFLIDTPHNCSDQRALTDARGRYEMRDVPGNTATLKGPGDVRVSTTRGKTTPDLVITKAVP